MSYLTDLKFWISSRENKIWTALSIILIVVVLYYLTKNISDVDILIQKAGVFGPLVALLAYIILAPTPISTDPLTAFMIVFFGPVLGVTIGWMGNNLGAFTEYFVGRSVGRSAKLSIVKKSLPFGLDKLPIGSPFILTFGRAIPGYGGKLISFMAGMYEVPIKTFLWTTLLINLIGATLLSFGGYGLVKLIHLR